MPAEKPALFFYKCRIYMKTCSIDMIKPIAECFFI